MYPTIVGLLMIAVGAAIILFSEYIMRITNAWNRLTLGIEVPENWSRAGGVVVGVAMAFYGLLILLRFVNIK